MLERLQKIISAAGISSRRAAEQLIAEGRVRVNGKVVTELGSKADASRDHIKVDGKLINPQQPPTYVMLNKPAGFVTTMSDPEGRPTVHDLLKGIKARVYPVGRLDYNTEGLLLLTNDGDFAHLITHPRHEFPKTYLAKVKGVLDDRQIETLEKGMFLMDGRTAPARVKKVRKEEANSWVEITIHEGRKRQVRRMFDHVGSSVIRLKRTKTGSLLLGDLPEGTFRHLTSDEVKALRETALKTDDQGHEVRVYKAPEKRKEHVTQPIDATRPVSRTVEMRDTRQGMKKNQRPGSRPETRERAASGDRRNFNRTRSSEGRPSAFPDSRRRSSSTSGSRPGFSGSREGFVRRESRGEGPASRPGGRRSAGTGQRPAFGSREGFVRRESRGEGPASRSGERRPARTGQRPAFGSREGFVRRESRGEGPAPRSGERRPGPGRPGQRPAFGSQTKARGTERSGWRPASGPRPNKSKFTGGKGPGTRPGHRRG